MAKILLTGTSGQVGAALKTALAPLGEIIAPGRAEMDLGNPESMREFIREVAPRWIVNPAAYTAVDKAESEPELAYAVNEHAVRVFGEEAERLGAGVIHFSTDYVFDGSGDKPYRETDPTGPVSVYGASKLAGEKALAATGAGHMIFRTSWVYGATGKNFLLTILRLARERETMSIVDDQHGAPTWSCDLAKMTQRVIDWVEASARDTELKDALPQWNGVYHAAGSGETTWFGFASEGVRLAAEREPGVKFASLAGIPTTAYPTPAKRPANSRMSGEKLAARFGWTMMGWKESVAEVVKAL
ncbi:MAG: dTDP-4-dehydrorhamnose reductase [Edaphobacter sp.]|uniref:dTDP-4-dehydrorhamnose reductase n=1 Tax=Edaphobacter sp. TaxID=1934404 RepID=UPI0023965CB4|nr:dTDP-4-dehydrorhamnose reductase [Edaphobacter sp.]MDE1176989.1 dTDP-4-dehydrorhamnose reductase [Edaphobacter sp.]